MNSKVFGEWSGWKRVAFAPGSCLRSPEGVVSELDLKQVPIAYQCDSPTSAVNPFKNSKVTDLCSNRVSATIQSRRDRAIRVARQCHRRGFNLQLIVG